MRAYCFASGHIDFGNRVPAGATVIARGPDELLRDYLARHARRHVQQRGRGAGTAYLTVPGMPEASNPVIAIARLKTWCEHIAISAPSEVRVLPR